MACPIVRRRHAEFIAKRLAIAFLVLGAAPFVLAFHGAPSAIETLVFACSFAPLAATVVVARTGRLETAHAVAAFGLGALALSLYGLGCGVPIVVAWLLAALLEGSLSGDKRLTSAAVTICGGSLVVLACATALNTRPPSMAPTMAAVSAGLALVYAIIAGIGGDAMGEVPSTDQGEIEIRGAAAGMIDDLIIGLDAAGTVANVAEGASNPLGFVAADLMGRGLFEHVHIADRPAFLKHVADAAHGASQSNLKMRVRRPFEKDESPRPRYVWTELRATRLEQRRDASYGSASVVALLRDIDAAHGQGVETAAAQATLDEAIQSKDHFIANMSHELRTPLNAIIGFSEILASHTLRPADAERQREYARIIHQSGLHLLSVVNSILDMSKLRSGTFSIVPAAFDAVPLLDLACDIMALKADEGRITLVRDYPETLEEIVGDKRACKQILINLLSNAVKFTPEHGEVTLSARPEGNSLAITVKDNGVGIGAADLARLGNPFFQARSSLTRPFEGTGLGLSVVRGLVGLHGGTITLESELGHGTCVRVRLPLDCRTIGRKDDSAQIETLARRHAVEPRISPIDRRMKQIA